jgi:hypothetical protein
MDEYPVIELKIGPVLQTGEDDDDLDEVFDDTLEDA